MKKYIAATMKWPRSATTASTSQVSVNDSSRALAEEIGMAANDFLSQADCQIGRRFTFSYMTPINGDIRMLVAALNELYGCEEHQRSCRDARYGIEFVETDGFHHTFVLLSMAN